MVCMCLRSLKINSMKKTAWGPQTTVPCSCRSPAGHHKASVLFAAISFSEMSPIKAEQTESSSPVLTTHSLIHRLSNGQNYKQDTGSMLQCRAGLVIMVSAALVVNVSVMTECGRSGFL